MRKPNVQNCGTKDGRGYCGWIGGKDYNIEVLREAVLRVTNYYSALWEEEETEEEGIRFRVGPFITRDLGITILVDVHNYYQRLLSHGINSGSYVEWKTWCEPRARARREKRLKRKKSFQLL